MGLIYKLQKAVFGFIGDIKWGGITHPFWFTINASGYKLKGEHYRKVIQMMEPGDILLRRFEGYIDKWFIPGFWNHAGLYVGDVDGKPEQVVHAVSEGVLQEDFLNFIRTDHMIILRPSSDYTGFAIEKALKVVGSPYDFGFDFEKSNRFSCTELIDYCYPGLVKGKKRLGRRTVVADDFALCEKLKTVWDSVKDNEVTNMGVVQAYFSP